MLMVGAERFCFTPEIFATLSLNAPDDSSSVVAVTRTGLNHRREQFEQRIKPGKKGGGVIAAAAAADVPLDPKDVDAWAKKYAKFALEWASEAHSPSILRLALPMAGLSPVAPMFTSRDPTTSTPRVRSSRQQAAGRGPTPDGAFASDVGASAARGSAAASAPLAGTQSGAEQR